MAAPVSQDVLSNEVLSAAFGAVVGQESFLKKIIWWLVSPHAAERWLQFELAYELNRVYDGRRLVACEVDWVDFTIFDCPGHSPLWKNKPIARLELKMMGNWHVQPGQLSGIEHDIRKVNSYDPIASAALIFCTEVKGQAQNDLYDWCFEQIASWGKQTFGELMLDLKKCNSEIECIASIDGNDGVTTPFELLRFHLCVYRNPAARRLSEPVGNS